MKILILSLALLSISCEKEPKKAEADKPRQFIERPANFDIEVYKSGANCIYVLDGTGIATGPVALGGSC